MKTALLFAGQATQHVGMGRDLHDRFPEARAVFQAADDALGEPLTRLIFEGPDAELDRTENTQPAVLAVGLAGWAVLAARGFDPDVVAGHSLGEYGALVAAGALDVADAIRLVRRRGAYMQAAVPEGRGAMAAVQRLEDEAVETICAQSLGLVSPSAYNAPGVVIISGEAAAVAAACETLASSGAIVTPLAVSAPFHCALLAPAAAQLAEDLEATPLRATRLPYLANVDARWRETADPAEIRAALVEQVCAPVRWRRSIREMLDHGVERFWQLGPGRANLAHVKKQHRRAHTGSLGDSSEIDALLRELETK